MAFSSVVLVLPPPCVLTGAAAERVPETVDPCGFPAGGPGGVVAEVGALELDDGRDDLWDESASSGGNEAERSLCLLWVLPDR
ncbi:hypothetical protein MTO96_024825 [Rhipicephalus appendiculatus]